MTKNRYTNFESRKTKTLNILNYFTFIYSFIYFYNRLSNLYIKIIILNI